MVPKTATSTETKTITRIIHYVDKVTNQNVKEDVVQPVTLSRTKTETPVNPDPEVPTYETGKREELPNTGTEANATLASAGIMTLLAGLGLGFFKKKEDEK